jgi:hypothetical protein
MLAELAIANAAFAVIKETISNGGDIMSAGAQVFSFFDSKSKIAVEASKGDSDCEAFFALEQLKKSEEQLRELMIYTGRPGLWDDWLQFQVDARRKREEAIKADARKRYKARQKMVDAFNIVLAVLLVSTGLFAVVGLVWAIYTKGQF